MEDGHQQKCLVLANRHLARTLLQRLKDIRSYRRNRIHLRKMSSNQTDDRTDNTDYLEEEDADGSGNTCVVSNGESQMITPPVIQSEIPLRRSQRTIRKPVRYSNSNY